MPVRSHTSRRPLRDYIPAAPIPAYYAFRCNLTPYMLDGIRYKRRLNTESFNREFASRTTPSEAGKFWKHFRLVFLKGSLILLFTRSLKKSSPPPSPPSLHFPDARYPRPIVFDDTSRRIVRVETRGNLDARRQDLTRALSCTLPPPPFPTLSPLFVRTLAYLT